MGGSLKDYLILIFLYFLYKTKEWKRQQKLTVFLFKTKNNFHQKILTFCQIRRFNPNSSAKRLSKYIFGMQVFLLLS